MPVTLEIVEGPGAGRQLPVTRETVLGRDDSADVVLDDSQVSRRHARVAPEGSGLIVEDLGSLNGTFVNRAEVHGRAFASAGDEIQIGVTLFQVRTPADLATQASAVRAVPPALATAERVPDYVPAVATSAPAPPGSGVPELDRLVDAHVKSRARVAPLAVFVLAALIVIIYLGLQ